MSFMGDFGRKHPVSRTTHVDRLAGYHRNMADLSRLIQIQNMIQRTNREIEGIKSRLDQLEGAITTHQQHQVQAGDNQQPAHVQSPPLPIAELKQLAEMAKRFR